MTKHTMEDRRAQLFIETTIPAFVAARERGTLAQLAERYCPHSAHHVEAVARWFRKVGDRRSERKLRAVVKHSV